MISWGRFSVRILTFVLLLTLAIVMGCQGSALVKALTPKDFSVGNLYLRQPISEVEKMYGKPLKVGESISYKGDDHSLFERHYYQKFELEVSKYDPNSKFVDIIFVPQPGLKTPRSIGVGSTAREVLGKYGKPNLELRLAYLYSHEVTEDDLIYTCCLKMEFLNDKVKRMIVYIAEQ